MKKCNLTKTMFTPLDEFQTVSEEQLKHDCGTYCTAERCDICRDIYTVTETIKEGGKDVSICLYHGMNKDKADQIMDGTFGKDSHFQIDRTFISENDLFCKIYGSDIEDGCPIQILTNLFSLSTIGEIDVIFDNLRRLYNDCCMSPMPSNQTHIMEYHLPTVNGKQAIFVFELKKSDYVGQYIPRIRINTSKEKYWGCYPIKCESEGSIRRSFKKSMEFFSALHAVMENRAPENLKVEVLQKQKEFLALNSIEEVI